MPDFTPGKWWYVIPSHDTPVVLDSQSRAIVDRIRGATHSEAGANARLIACAPEMYIAITDLLGDETFRDEGMRKRMSAIIDRADGKLPYKMWSEKYQDVGKDAQ
ncbi:MAG: hypothetical protein IJG36_04515 [Synergistaceae bacterium]|nr:hypothetical protein [Synergistaceae bacterium]